MRGPRENVQRPDGPLRAPPLNFSVERMGRALAALARFDVTFVEIGLFTCCWGAFFAALYWYRANNDNGKDAPSESQRLTTLALVMAAVGCCIASCGVVLLTRQGNAAPARLS